jgi:hypothetical protein
MYLSHQRVLVLTDHIALVNLQKMHLSESSRLVRWAIFLQSYDFEIQYKKGIKTLVADGLSRRSWPEDDHKPTETEAMTDATEFTPGPECLPLAPVSIDNESTPQTDRTYVEFRYDKATIASVSVPVIGQLPDLEDVKDSIRACPDFADIFWYLSNGKLPDDDKVAREIILQAPDFMLENGV